MAVGLISSATVLSKEIKQAVHCCNFFPACKAYLQTDNTCLKLKEICWCDEAALWQFVEPLEASEETLLDVHTPEYLRWLHGSKCKVAKVCHNGLPIAALLPVSWMCNGCSTLLAVCLHV